MKNGLFLEDNQLIYYKDDVPTHAGVIKDGDDYYYISSNGYAVKGVHHVHTVMAHGLLKRGTYTFGDDYKLIKGSYKPPKHSKHKKHKKRKNKKSPIKLNKKQKLFLKITYAVLALFIVAGIVAIAISVHNQKNRTPDNSNDNNSIIVSDFDEKVLLCSDGAKKLYDDEIAINIAKKTGDPYRPMQFDYLINNESVGTLILSEYENLSEPKQYTLDPQQTSVRIDNLKTNTMYYYKVVCNSQEYYGTLTTDKSYRFVFIDGLINTRDIGGYKTLDGKTIKQDILIRGTEIDALVMRDYIIPSESIDTVLNDFGFVYDFDLRSPTIFSGKYQTRFGKDVKHKFYDSPAYAHIFTDGYKDNLKTIFSDLADSKNYPMYMHCTYGTDRTGTIVYLLQGVLGVSHDDMKTEYMLTSFYNQVSLSEYSLESVDEGLEKYRGDTIQEKIVDFLKTDIGVTQKEIDSIRNIYLED